VTGKRVATQKSKDRRKIASRRKNKAVIKKAKNVHRKTIGKSRKTKKQNYTRNSEKDGSEK